MRELKFAILISTLVAAPVLAATPPAPFSVEVPFEVTEHGGGAFQKIMKNLASKEAVAMVTAGCAIFGMDCSETAASAAQTIKKLFVQNTETAGETHKGIIKAPVGYEICKAAIKWSKTGISSDTTFTTTIIRTPALNGLGWQVTAQKKAAQGTGVTTILYLSFVPGGQVEKNQCWPVGVHPWDCKGPNAPENCFYPGAHH